MAERDDATRILRDKLPEAGASPRQILEHVYLALREKGYDPCRQIAYYLITGEPAYVTAHHGARSLVSKLDRDEVIEELVRYYLTHGSRQSSPTA